MSNVLKMLSRGGAAAADTDPDFKQTVLLLHGDGTNGAQNNTFLDSSTNNFTITRNGNTTQGTFSPFSAEEGKWAAYFPINSTSSPSQRLQSSISTAFGTNNFTIDFWIYVIGTNSASTVLDMRTGTGIGLVIGLDTTSQLNVQSIGTGAAGTFIASSSATAVPTHTWTHVAVVRSGTGTDEVTVYINGVSAATGTCADSFTTTSVTLCNRYTSTSVNTTQCYLSNFRISDVARTISLPSSPYTSDANTKLLVCQSNRFVDNGADSRTVTLPDATKPSITPFSPFAPTAAYSAGTNGGSGYFDGTGDYLTITSGVTNQFDPGSAFTLEGWFYQTNTANCIIFEVRGNTDSFANTDGILYRLWTNFNGNSYFQFKNGTTNISILGTTPPNNTWNHLAVGYNGTTTRFWINGVSVGISTSSYTVPTYNRVTIGNNNNQSAPNPFFGYLSNMRFVKGSDVYGVSNTSITVPTSPVTAITNTSLLLNFTNAGIIDNTGKNNLETVGDAQIDTTTKKFGTGSLEFDGTGDRLTNNNFINPDLIMGTGSFTIEGWLYTTSTANMGLLQISTTAGGLQANNTNNIAIYCNNLVLGAYYGGTFRAGTTSISSGTWTHFALVRNGSSINLYINGTADSGFGTQTDNQNYTGGYIVVGGYFSTSFLFNGFIDDLRITKGVARYTSNFTPPTKEFPDQ